MARKAQLTAVYEALNGQPPSLRKAGHIDSFVKLECYPQYKPARMINSRTDCFKVFAGPYVKAIEDQIYADEHFIKHIPVADRWKRVLELKKSFRYYYATDYTAFESHFTPKQMRNIECVLYKSALRGQVHAQFLCDVLCGKNRCRTRSGIKCTINGRRMSGDMTTSLGNGVSNMFLIEYLMHKKGQLPGHYDYLVEGDDGIIGCNVPLEPIDFKELGFTIKIDRVADPCTASFCGLIFSDNGVNIRDPVRFFIKFGWTSSHLLSHESVMWQLLKAKCLSALYETPNCPLVSIAAYYCLTQCGDCVPLFEEDNYHSELYRACESFDPAYPCVPVQTRVLFQEMFNVTLEQQIAMESDILGGDFSSLSYLNFHPDLIDYHDKYVCTL